MESIFQFLKSVDNFFWSYIGFSLVAILGGYFTLKTGFFQIRGIPSAFKTFAYFFNMKTTKGNGSHPLKVFFASVGGMIGVGNIVGIITALQLGGPGAVFWVWIAAFLGSLIKYSEVFLGLKYRVANKHGGFDGGAIYFLRKAFNAKWVGLVACVLLCIYGVEVYQFSILTHTLSKNWNLNHYLVVGVLLALIFYVVLGGINRVGKVAALLIPAFTCCYMIMCLWVICHHLPQLPGLIGLVFKSAFTGHAAVGGFAGGSIALAMQQGIARAIYSADIGIGYDSIIQSETSTDKIAHQARLAMLGVFIDNTVCTFTLLVGLATGLWKAMPAIDSSMIIQTALAMHFPGQNFFMPLFLLILIFTTLTSYLFVGFKCARFLNEKHGGKIYFAFSFVFLLFFSFFDPAKALLVMSISGCLLLSVNLLGIYRLRKEIEFTSTMPELVQNLQE